MQNVLVEESDDERTPFHKQGISSINASNNESIHTQPNRALRNRSLVIALITLVVYVTADLLIPLYNKSLFNGFGSQQGFHYPITTAFIQVAFVSFTLLLYNLASQCLFPQPDWIFRDFTLLKRKMRKLVLVSFLFGAIIALSGLGLDKASLSIYVLLRTTSIIWVVVLSLIFGTEKVSAMAMFSAAFVAAGAVLLSIDVSRGWSLGQGNLPGALIILASSFCSGAATVLLRRVVLETEKEPQMFMPILDMTMLKMGMAAAFMFLPAFIMETLIPALSDHPENIVWQAFIDQWPMALVCLGGVLVTMLYQSAIVAFTTHSQAISVGIVHQMILLPQLVLYTVLQLTKVIPPSWKLKVFQFTPTMITGAVLVITGTLIYAIVKLIKNFGFYKRWAERTETSKGWTSYLLLL